LPAGNLHAYLHGPGVEIMASSDNVLRGGLTPKHVDVAELTRVVRFDAPPIRVLRPRALGPGEVVWDTPAEEFRLARAHVSPDRPYRARPFGPEILLCVEGRVRAEGSNGQALELAPGTSAYVAGTSETYTHTGSGAVFRATVGVERS